MGKRLCNGDFSFLPVPQFRALIESQSELPTRLLVGESVLDRVM